MVISTFLACLLFLALGVLLYICNKIYGFLSSVDTESELSIFDDRVLQNVHYLGYCDALTDVYKDLQDPEFISKVQSVHTPEEMKALLDEMFG